MRAIRWQRDVDNFGLITVLWLHYVSGIYWSTLWGKLWVSSIMLRALLRILRTDLAFESKVRTVGEKMPHGSRQFLGVENATCKISICIRLCEDSDKLKKGGRCLAASEGGAPLCKSSGL